MKSRRYCNLFLFFKSLTGSILNVQNLSLALVDVTNWHTLGIRLGVPVNKLKIIEQSYPMNSERCKHEMLFTWLQMTPFAGWRDVAKALHEMECHHAANTVHRVHESGWYFVILEAYCVVRIGALLTLAGCDAWLE